MLEISPSGSNATSNPANKKPNAPVSNGMHLQDANNTTSQSIVLSGGEGGDPVQDKEIDLSDVFNALIRRRYLVLGVMSVTFLVGTSHTLWQRVVNPVYAGSFQLLVRDPINRDDRGAEDSSRGLESLALNTGGTANTTTLIQVLSSPLLLEPIAQKTSANLGKLSSSLSITPVKGPKLSNYTGEPGVLDIKLEWKDKKQGQEILEEVKQQYLGFAMKQRQERLTQGLSFLDQQAPELQSRVDRLQQRLANFREQNSYVEPVAQAQTIQNQRLELATQLKQLQQGQARLEVQLSEVRMGRLKSVDAKSSTNASNPDSSNGLVEMTQDFLRVEKELAEAEASFNSNVPQLAELRAQRQKLLPLLQKRQLNSLYSSLKGNLTEQATIKKQLDGLGAKFASNPNQIREYDRLQQQLDVARENLTSYIKARENFRLQVAQRTVPWRVLEQPKFISNPIKPNISRNLLLSLFLGGVAGIFIALLRDRFDHVFHWPQEAEQGLGLPLLSVIPFLTLVDGYTIEESIGCMDAGQRFALKESLRNLFANFKLLRTDKAFRSIGITSSIPGEGKSTSLTLFANTLASLQVRVLLVDADMRRPRLHRYNNLVNETGFSTLITDPESKVENLVQHMSPNLDLLSAGPMPPDPTRLLASERCREVLQSIKSQSNYDVILFDMPPCFQLSDGLLLSEHLDGLLFLVGLDYADRTAAKEAVKRITNSGINILGMVANHRKKYSRYNVNKGYGYGYGYGYSDHYADTERAQDSKVPRQSKTIS